jgi:hypothetical protein
MGAKDWMLFYANGEIRPILQSALQSTGLLPRPWSGGSTLRTGLPRLPTAPCSSGLTLQPVRSTPDASPGLP